MSQTLNAAPARLGAMRAGELAARGHDYTYAMAVSGDTIASITSVTVVRRDGVTIGVNDLTITPSGTQPPWTTAVAFGQPSSPGYVVNWWQTSGSAIATPTSVDYQITIKCVTTLGATLIRDCYQLVVSGLG